MTDKSHLFWDSCVFQAFLKDESHAYDVDSISQYLNDAKSGNVQIYTSSIALAEIVPSSIQKSAALSIEAFLDDFRGAITVISPSPNVMIQAGRLRDLPYKKGKSPGRRLSTPDAIMLASCIELVESFGVSILSFHTFDNGKKRDPVEGKMVPLLSYHEWCDFMSKDQLELANKVISISRKLPTHPQLKLGL
jgi:predicted nucleic acid-binding protein